MEYTKPQLATMAGDLSNDVNSLEQSTKDTFLYMETVVAGVTVILAAIAITAIDVTP